MPSIAPRRMENEYKYCMWHTAPVSNPVGFSFQWKCRCAHAKIIEKTTRHSHFRFGQKAATNVLLQCRRVRHRFYSIFFSFSIVCTHRTQQIWIEKKRKTRRNWGRRKRTRTQINDGCHSSVLLLLINIIFSSLWAHAILNRLIFYHHHHSARDADERREEAQ